MPRKILVLILVLFGVASKATHLISYQLSVHYLDSISPTHNLYKLQLDAFRDCKNSEVQFDQEALFGLYQDKTAQRLRVIKIQSYTSRYLLSPCRTEDFCVEVASYSAQVILLRNDTDYIFTYERCCRPAVSNLEDGPNDVPTQSVYSIVRINTGVKNHQAKHNKVFENCGSGIQLLPLSLRDEDADSIVVEVTSPELTLNATLTNAYPQPAKEFTSPQAVLFKSGFSAWQPFGADGVFEIYQGYLRVGIPNPGAYAAAIMVKEYRNGQLIASNTSDLIFYNRECTSGENQSSKISAKYGQGVSALLDWTFCIQAADSQVLYRNRQGSTDTIALAEVDLNQSTYHDSSDLKTQSLYRYQVRLFDSAGLELNRTEWVEIGFGRLGVQDMQESDFLLYPNPTEGELHLRLPEASGHITVYDALGKKVMEREAKNELEVHLTHPGFYLVEWRGNGFKFTQKVIVQ